MENKNKKQWLTAVFSALAVVIFFAAWWSINRVILSADGLSWWIPIGWFSLGISLVCAMALAIADMRFLSTLASMVLATGLFWNQSPLLFLAIIFGVLLVLSGIVRMRRDLDSHIAINVRRSMHHGMGRIIIGASAIISLFYYSQIIHLSVESLLQRLSLSQASHQVLIQALGWMNPEFQKVNRENVSVDDFLKTIQESQMPQEQENPSDMTDMELLRMSGIEPGDPRAPQVLSQIRNELKKSASRFDVQAIAIEQSRKQLSEIYGAPLTGKENVADVFSAIIDQRVRTYFQPEDLSEESSLLPFILTIILFFTLLSIGSVLSFFWGFIATLFFVLFQRIGLITVRKVMVEKEVVE